MAFYLKHRPQKIEELDLTGVRESLQKYLSSKNIPHAFLFSGPRGAGKTSAARIVAKVINCTRKGDKPCNKCSQCMSITNGSNVDVVEMDAASNRRIDDVRALRENVVLAPAAASKKVYIIDEAHMLTNEAFNAFLKTLEEPPDHVMFIMATTDPEKLPETVRSRLTRINFKKANSEEVVRQLKRVSKAEKLNVEKGALELIAKNCDGSFREAVKILEELSIRHKKISENLVSKFFRSKKVVSGEKFIEVLIKKDVSHALEMIEEVVEKGGVVKDFLGGVLQLLREELLDGRSEFIDLIELLMNASQVRSPIVQLPLEIAVIRWCGGIEKNNNEGKVEVEKEIVEEKPEPVKTGPVKVKGDKIEDEVWRRVMNEIRMKNITVEALLRAARPLAFDGKTLSMGVYYSFHKERLEVNAYKQVLEDVAGSVFGKPVRVQYSITEKKVAPSETDKSSYGAMALTDSGDGDIISAAKEIFGN